MYDVREIVEIINREGRQGPKDLKSDEVYSWVTRVKDISYDDYLNILKDNAIEDKDREINRDAYFIVKNGKYEFFKTKEQEIRKYCCYVVKHNPNITSAEVIEKVKLLYNKYTPIDLMEQKNLDSKQPIIHQTMRNIMVSNYTRRPNNILFYKSETSPFTFTLKPDGEILADELEIVLENKKLEYLSENNPESITDQIVNGYTPEELEYLKNKNQNFNYSDVKDKGKSISQRVPTDERIKLTRFQQTEYRCESDESHITFSTEKHPNFLEGHHHIPLSAQRVFPNINLDCIENMVALCPNCHKKIHYATDYEKYEMFSMITQKRIIDLNSMGFSENELQEIFKNFY